MERALKQAFGSHNNHLDMTKLIMSGNYGLMHFYDMIVIPMLDTADYNDPNHELLLSTLRICCEALTRKLRNVGKVSKPHLSLIQISSRPIQSAKKPKSKFYKPTTNSEVQYIFG